MTKKRFGFIRKLLQAPIFRMYVAIVWRYLAWLFALNIILFVFAFASFLIFPDFIKDNIDAFDSFLFVVRHYIVHLLGFYLSLESVMSVGFKSGHYKLSIENMRSKKK